MFCRRSLDALALKLRGELAAHAVGVAEMQDRVLARPKLAALVFARKEAAWRDLPEELGKWLSVWRQFRRWTLAGLCEDIWMP